MSKSKNISQIIDEKTNVIQAVLVADNFTQNFAPLSNDFSTALIPLVNVPLVDYTLESLSLGGIEETFLLCSRYPDSIKEHIRKRIAQGAQWSLTMRVNVVVSEDAHTLGDALRSLDSRGLVRGDFVLASAGVVSNIKLEPLLKKHKDTVKKDRGAVMTVLYQKVAPEPSVIPNGNNVVVSNGQNRLLHFDDLDSTDSSHFNIPLDMFLTHSIIHVRHDVRETGLAICSAAVLMLFSDNFDFQTGGDFVRGILMNEEILGSSIYWHEVNPYEYGANCTDWPMYQRLSREIIHRWVYPLVPDMGISVLEQKYMYLRNNVYKSKNVKLAMGSELLDDVVVAKDTTVSDHSSITRSIIGEKCRIGKNVTISDSYILPKTVISDGCTISHSVIGPNCYLGIDCRVEKGCVLGTGVHLENGLALTDHELVQATEPEDGLLINKLGDKAYKIKLDDTEDASGSDSEDEVKLQIPRLRTDSLGKDADAVSIASSTSQDRQSDRNSPILDDTTLFINEVTDSLKRGYEEKVSCDNLIVEINSSRYAYNISVKEVNVCVVKAVLHLPLHMEGEGQYLSRLKPLLVYFSDIFANYMKTEEAMMNCLEAVQETAYDIPEFLASVSNILHFFYGRDVITEECVVRWHSQLKRDELYDRVKPFVRWLEEAEEETESE